MTTIAYRDGVLAADTRSSAGDCVMSDNQLKIVRRGRIMAAATGTTAMCREFRAWVFGGLRGEPPANPHPANSEWSYWGIVVTPAGAWVFTEPGVTPVTSPYYALGSGRDFALGAMAAGASATEAVAAAMRHDTCSGGEITSHSVR